MICCKSFARRHYWLLHLAVVVLHCSSCCFARCSQHLSHITWEAAYCHLPTLSFALHCLTHSLVAYRLGVSLDRRRTVALCLSHSGQTFPTLQAARILSQSLPGRVFAMSGSIDTCMSLVVGQSNWKVTPLPHCICHLSAAALLLSDGI